MGILILIVFSVGVFAIGKWIFTKVLAVYRKNADVNTSVKAPRAQTAKTGLFGVPKYKDVIVPNRRDYSSVVYMDTAFKQYVYDVRAGWKFMARGMSRASVMFSLVGGTVITLAFPVFVTVLWLIIVAWFAFIAAPKATRIERDAAEYHKDRSPEFWLSVDQSIMESRLRVSEMTEALQNSGVGSRLHW